MRVALVQKKLQPGTLPAPGRELTIKEVMEETVRLHEAREVYMEEQRQKRATSP